MMYRLLFPFLVFCLGCVQAQPDINKAVADFINEPDLKGAAISISVERLNSGKRIASYQPNTRLTPASIQKLVVTSAALDILGPDYTFTTRLVHSGKIDENGILNGDLIIQGGGDPSLGSPELESAVKFEDLQEQWVAAIQKAGIKKITGKIIGDGGHYEGYFAGPGWPWEDLGNYYGAGVWGLNILENSFELNFQLSNNKSKGPQIIKQYPGIPNLLLLNELKTGDPDSGDQAFIFGGPFSYKRWIRGSLPQGTGQYTIYGSIPDPAYFAAYHLRQKLLTAGIDSKSATTQIDAPFVHLGLKNIHEIKSPPLSELVRAANHESINLYCEVFLREIGKERKSGEKGLEKLAQWLTEKGIDNSGFILKDGSGLTPQNAISASAMCSLIRNRKSDNSFTSSLPIGGVNGTAKYVLKNSQAKGKVMLKSGSMSGVRAYAGIANPEGGEPLVFCIIANNFTAKSGDVRRAMERFMEKLVIP